MSRFGLRCERQVGEGLLWFCVCVCLCGFAELCCSILLCSAGVAVVELRVPGRHGNLEWVALVRSGTTGSAVGYTLGAAKGASPISGSSRLCVCRRCFRSPVGYASAAVGVRIPWRDLGDSGGVGPERVTQTSRVPLLNASDFRVGTHLLLQVCESHREIRVTRLCVGPEWATQTRGYPCCARSVKGYAFGGRM